MPSDQRGFAQVNFTDCTRANECTRDTRKVVELSRVQQFPVTLFANQINPKRPRLCEGFEFYRIIAARSRAVLQNAYYNTCIIHYPELLVTIPHQVYHYIMLFALYTYYTFRVQLKKQNYSHFAPVNIILLTISVIIMVFFFSINQFNRKNY